MTANATAAANASSPVHIVHAMVGTALTAVLAVLFGVSVIVELSNTPDWALRTDAPLLAATATSAAPMRHLLPSDEAPAAF